MLSDKSNERKKIKKTINLIHKCYQDYKNDYDKLALDAQKKFYQSTHHQLVEEIETYQTLGYDYDFVFERIKPKCYALINLAINNIFYLNLSDADLENAIALSHNNLVLTKDDKLNHFIMLFPIYLNYLFSPDVHVVSSTYERASYNYEIATKIFSLFALDVTLLPTKTTKKNYGNQIFFASISTLLNDCLEGKLMHYSCLLVDQTERVLFANLLSSHKVLKKSDIDSLDMYKIIYFILLIAAHCYPVNNRVFMTLNADGLKEDIKGCAEKISQMSFVQKMNVYGAEKMPTLVEYNLANGSINLTKNGEYVFFKYWCDDEIKKFARGNVSKIIEFAKGKYERELDYVITNNGSIILTEHGIIKALCDADFKKLNNLYDNWYHEDYLPNQTIFQSILTAYLLLGCPQDYHLESVNDEQDKIILHPNSLIIKNNLDHNATIEALEFKELYLKNNHQLVKNTYNYLLKGLNIVDYVKKYSKVSGLTAVPNTYLYNDLFNLSDYSLKRATLNVNYEEKIFKEKSAKNRTIINDILAANEKEQPVLVITSSVNDAQHLYQELKTKHKKNPTLLIDSYDNNKVRKVIDYVAIPKNITIINGTIGLNNGIDLGGTLPALYELIENTVDKSIANVMKILTEREDILMGLKDIRDQVEIQMASSMKSIEQKTVKKYETLKNTHADVIDNIIKSGGLKVIVSSHSQTLYEEEQIKSLCHNHASLAIYNSCDELLSLGISKEVIDNIMSINKMVTLSNENNPLTSHVLASQINYETKMKKYLMATLEKENNINSMASYLCHRFNNYLSSEEILRIMLADLVSKIIADYVFAELDSSKLITTFKTKFNLHLNTISVNQYTSLDDMRNDIVNLLYNRIMKNTKTTLTQKQCKIHKYIDKIWLDFLDYFNDIRTAYTKSLNQALIQKMDEIIQYNEEKCIMSLLNIKANDSKSNSSGSNQMNHLHIHNFRPHEKIVLKYEKFQG